MLFMAWLFSVTASIPQVSLLYPRQQRNGGPPVVHYIMPPVADVRLIPDGPLAILFAVVDHR